MAVEKRIRSRRSVFVYLASVLVLPLAVQARFLTDIHGFVHPLLFVEVTVVFALYGALLLVGELVFRGRLSGNVRRVPWLAVAWACLYVPWFYAPAWVTPVVLENPRWCRVNQGVRWPTVDGRAFYAMFVGRGNLAEHDLESGYMNWIGPEPAGIGFSFSPFTIDWWEGSDHVEIAASRDAVRDRVALSGLPEAEVESLADSMWRTIESAKSQRAVVSPDAIVEPMTEQPFGYEAELLGGIVWMLALVVVFSGVGWISLAESHATIPETPS